MGKAPDRDSKNVSPDTTLVVTDSQIVPVGAPPPPPPRTRDPDVSMWAGAVVLSDEFKPKAKPAPRRRWWPWIAGGVGVVAVLALAVSLSIWGPWYPLEDTSAVIRPAPAADPAPPAPAAAKKKKKPLVKPRK